MLSRADAQRRADRIAAFRDEIAALGDEGVTLDAAQLDAVRAHHEALLQRLARDHDVDATAAARQMSLGMRIASLLGAAALTAAVVSFVMRVWGSVPVVGQVALLTAAPMTALGLMVIAARIEKTRYVAALLAIVACAAFAMQIILLGQLFNLRESPHAIGAWAAFTLIVAVSWRFALPFAGGVAAVAIYVPAAVFWTSGIHWTAVFERPEAVILTAGALLPALALTPGDLQPSGRRVLLLMTLAPLLVLSSWEQPSLLPVSDGAAAVLYQFVAVGAAIAAIGAGMHLGQRDTVMIGSLFGAAFMLVRFVDWWWDWMPKYLFFLIIASVAVGWLWALRVVRRRMVVS